MFAIVGAVRFDDTHVIPSVVFGVIPKKFTDLLAAAFFTFSAGADVYDLLWRILFFAHVAMEYNFYTDTSFVRLVHSGRRIAMKLF